MYVDKDLEMSDSQAVTVTAASTNQIDLGAVDAITPKKNLKAEPIEVMALVDGNFAGGTSLQVSLQTADQANFSDVADLLMSGAVPVASLKVGYRFPFSCLAQGVKRYIRMNYVVVGTMTSGTMSAFLTPTRDTV